MSDMGNSPEFTSNSHLMEPFPGRFGQVRLVLQVCARYDIGLFEVVPISRYNRKSIVNL